MRELWQLIPLVCVHALFMDVSHLTVSFSKGPRFIILGTKHLNRIPHCSVLVFCIYELDNVFALFFHHWLFGAY